MRVFLTGAGGFLGSHLLDYILTNTDWEVVATDSFRHKGRCDRVVAVTDGKRAERVQVITHDLVAPFSGIEVMEIGPIDLVIAMASESHVDRSINDPVPFVKNNVDVILNTLELAKKLHPEMILVMSTDEVYGPCEPGHTMPEWSPILPSNPYSASKAAQEAIAISYWRTYNLPIVLLNVMNLYGEMQDAEKFIPRVIRAVLDGDEVGIHGEPGRIGSRHYLYAQNLASAMMFIYSNLPAKLFTMQGAGEDIPRPDRYNIAGEQATDNLELAEKIADIVGNDLYYTLTGWDGRPGHDPHYSLDPSKLLALGWKAPYSFEDGLADTVAWYIENPEWLEEY
jgi:dTDP-glucose 4,6-dehydratase